MSDVQQLIRHAAQYLAGRAGLMILGFLSFPVLTRILPVSQYGELSLLLKIGLLWTVLSKCGLQNAALRFFPEQGRLSPESRSICASTLIVEAALCAGVMVIVGAALVRSHLIPLSAQIATLAPLLLALIAVRSVQPILSGLLRAERRTWLFNLCELSGKALGIGLSLAAISLIAVDLHYYLGGLLVAEGAVVVGIVMWFHRAGLFAVGRFRLGIARSAWVFSAPLIAYELTSVVLDSGDRLLIGRYLGLHQLGLYSAAYSIATYAEEALMAPVNLALIPAYMKIWVEQGAQATSQFLSQTLDIFVMIAGAVALIIYVTSDDIIRLLASKKFAAAHSILPVIVCGLLVYATHIFFNAPLLIHKRSLTLTAVTAGSCLVNVGLNVFLLPRIGIMGAAIATLVSYLLFVVTILMVSRRYLAFSLPINTLLCCIGTAGGLIGAARQFTISGSWLNLAIKPPLVLVLYTISLALLRPRLRGYLLSWIAPRMGTPSSMPAVDA